MLPQQKQIRWQESQKQLFCDKYEISHYLIFFDFQKSGKEVIKNNKDVIKEIKKNKKKRKDSYNMVVECARDNKPSIA